MINKTSFGLTWPYLLTNNFLGGDMFVNNSPVFKVSIKYNEGHNM